MIQRIQSIYLVVASLLSGLLIFFFELWTNVDGFKIFAFQLFNRESLTVSGIPFLFIGSALLSFITIFLYKNRKLQFVMGRVNILINLILLGLLVYHVQKLSGEVFISEKGIGTFIPIIVIVLLVIANKAIKKDEDLVKSVDRLR